MFRNAIGAVLGAAALATVLATPAGAQQDRMQGGTLECSLSSSIGMVVTSSRNVACNFKPRGGPPEAYVGTLTRVGLDIGITGGGAIIWGVFTSTNLYAGMLTGTYVARRRKPLLRRVSAPTCWSAARTVRWRCSRFRCRARPDSISRPA